MVFVGSGLIRGKPGADPGFQVGGGGTLKKNCAERREVRNYFGYLV